MANRNRTNPVQFYLSDDEQYILNTKFKASGMIAPKPPLKILFFTNYKQPISHTLTITIHRYSASISKQIFDFYQITVEHTFVLCYTDCMNHFTFNV